ncbi:hypothetical protein F511_38242 [Dorcoceras hygrometricum]|uniref:Uncharacterized protein n=1 Tax=Dorcoceras hygrometricum TaxID=472368 RepID=A0A2Z7C8S8_9LAMI|nr:hypothetical protein F511_38242 [Dorcoceras hygrometricum]
MTPFTITCQDDPSMLSPEGRSPWVWTSYWSMCLVYPSNLPKCWNQLLSNRISYWYFSRCVLVESSSSSTLDFSRWCISAYPVVARDQLLRVISCCCSPYWGLTPRSLWGCCVCLPVCCSGFPGFAAGRGYDPADGAPGGG